MHKVRSTAYIQRLSCGRAWFNALHSLSEKPHARIGVGDYYLVLVLARYVAELCEIITADRKLDLKFYGAVCRDVSFIHITYVVCIIINIFTAGTCRYIDKVFSVVTTINTFEFGILKCR